MKAWWQRSGGLAVSRAFVARRPRSWGLAFVGTTAQVMSPRGTTAFLSFSRKLRHLPYTQARVLLPPVLREESSSWHMRPRVARELIHHLLLLIGSTCGERVQLGDVRCTVSEQTGLFLQPGGFQRVAPGAKCLDVYLAGKNRSMQSFSFKPVSAPFLIARAHGGAASGKHRRRPKYRG